MTEEQAEPTLTLKLYWDTHTSQWLWRGEAPNVLPEFVGSEHSEYGYVALEQVLLAAGAAADRWLNPEIWARRTEPA